MDTNPNTYSLFQSLLLLTDLQLDEIGSKDVDGHDDNDDNVDGHDDKDDNVDDDLNSAKFPFRIEIR